jgi:4,5:9,10-diseco-3-hydroxy-5,9,17-trioxoandrosta-1(10),2-diene-4-oate hydrolase
LKRQLRRFVCDDDKITPELVEEYFRPFTSAEGRRAKIEITRNIIGKQSMNEILPRLHQPVLILVGSEDPMISPENQETLQSLLANARLEIVDDCGHFLYLEAPELVSSQIVDFINEAR